MIAKSFSPYMFLSFPWDYLLLFRQEFGLKKEG
jgi:hypothetical protein